MPNKTQPTTADPLAFLATLDDQQKHADCQWILQQMERITGEPARMWGPSIIGFGTYHYVYASGREGDWMVTGFSSRKANITLYLMSGVERETELLGRLGKYKTGKSCLYIKRLRDIDREVLTELIEASVARVRNMDIRY